MERASVDAIGRGREKAARDHAPSTGVAGVDTSM